METKSTEWWLAYRTGMDTRGVPHLELDPAVIHRIEAEEGISEDLSDRWDKTLERWFG